MLSAMIRRAKWQIFTDVSEKPSVSTFRIKQSKKKRTAITVYQSTASSIPGDFNFNLHRLKTSCTSCSRCGVSSDLLQIFFLQTRSRISSKENIVHDLQIKIIVVMMNLQERKADKGTLLYFKWVLEGIVVWKFVHVLLAVR